MIEEMLRTQAHLKGVQVNFPQVGVSDNVLLASTPNDFRSSL